LSVRSPSHKDTHSAAKQDVERMVPSVHDSRYGDTRSCQSGNKNDDGAPDLATLVEDMQLPSEI
jgi:hypothetical protein